MPDAGKRDVPRAGPGPTVRCALAGLGLLAALALGGCGSAQPAIGSGAGQEPGPPSVRDQLVALAIGTYDTPQDLAEGGCFADELLAHVEESELVRTGVLDPANADGLIPRLPKRLVDPWVEAQFDCLDHVRLATRTQIFATNGKVDALAYSACYARKVTEEQSRGAARAALLRQTRGPAWEAVRAAEDRCLREALTLN